MTMIEATRACLRKYLVVSGRAPRVEFWKFILFLLLAHLVLVLAHSFVFGPAIEVRLNENGQPVGYRKNYSAGFLGDILFFATLLPWLAVIWRGMHDTGKPGWLAFAPLALWFAAMMTFFVAVLGPGRVIEGLSGSGVVRIENVSGYVSAIMFLWAIVQVTLWLAAKSQPGPYRYGPNPNEVTL